MTMKSIGMMDDPIDSMTEARFRENCWKAVSANMLAIFQELGESDWLPFKYTQPELHRLAEEMNVPIKRLLWHGQIEPHTPKEGARERHEDTEQFLGLLFSKPTTSN